jgi:hypothetical protein
MTDASVASAKRPAPWRGRKRVKDPRDKFIAVRCTPAEYAAIAKKAEQAGLKIGSYLRSVALGDPGPRAARRPPIKLEQLSRILGLLGNLTSNVNQMTRRLNQSGFVPGLPELLAIRGEASEVCEAIRKALGRDH